MEPPDPHDAGPPDNTTGPAEADPARLTKPSPKDQTPPTVTRGGVISRQAFVRPRLVALGAMGDPYVDVAGRHCYEVQLPARLTAKPAAEIVIREGCIVLLGQPGHIITPAGATTLAHRIASRVPLVMLDLEPLAARVLERAIRYVLGWVSETAA